ncbi:macrolide transporter subunit MacA [Pandoraea nosoerga]|uniref:Efflux transporter periplasmic adaptor subunit n=1 Tax=Pandoraea nosoerga TaxID=2508296 RepID=A0A5E4VYC0_9BURK|nr:macrolide transporter subunit MacA [Pandoraea nosoerga]MBN4666242.1 macrolide transporter subunit MacA [Pandoraea nosoerga]MBN4676297.1 macrolide transporter subunit MacA [Pandoraea nosoerga]MBN4681334.1 macrolide transporter subunit MacA [Pandoraea nosoerga]MBN4745409.1 macrolide transporter subunit MacA [Pandoraea nosoerga]VVE17422.1 efflux transporter periplasmic adaptor subunit [Pandoraea nosoerga]
MIQFIRRRRYLAASLVVLLVLVVLGLRSLASPKPPQYISASVERGDLENTVLATGTLGAFQQVDVGAQVTGQLKSLKVKLGDKVRKGQWLAQIDPVLAQNGLRSAEADMQNLQAQKRSTQAQLRQAELAFARQRQMLPDESTSRQDFEAAQAALDTQRAALAGLDAQILKAAVAIETAKANVGYTRIEAPIDGEVVAIVTQEGQTVVAQQQAPVILKLADLNTITVKAQVSEADVIRVEPGQTAYFTILGDADKRYYGKLRAIEPAPQNYLDTQSTLGGGAARNNTAVFYNALFDVPNPDHRLRISMTAQVNVLLGTAKQALSVPVAALGKRVAPNRYEVRVLGADGKASTRQIVTGLNNNVRVQVREGLAQGERVVIGEAGESTPAGAQGSERSSGVGQGQ